MAMPIQSAKMSNILMRQLSAGSADSLNSTDLFTFGMSLDTNLLASIADKRWRPKPCVGAPKMRPVHSGFVGGRDAG